MTMMAVIVMVSMASVVPILRHIDALVPAFLDKIDRSSASAVAMTVFVPVLYMLGRGIHIHGGRSVGCRLDDHGLRVDQLRCRIASQVKAAVKARLTYADRKVIGVADVGKEGEQQCCRIAEESFHTGKRAKKSRCGSGIGWCGIA